MAGTAREPQMDEDVEGSDSAETGEEEDGKMKSTKDIDPPVEGHSGESLLEKRKDPHQRETTEGERTDRHLEGGDGVMERNPIIESVKQKHKAHLREKYTCINEGTSDSQSRLENVYTRLFITEQTEDYGIKVHEILDQFKLPHERSPYSPYQEIDCLNIFKPGKNFAQRHPAKESSTQRVMTKGIAGIGKTVAVQNFSLNWAEGKSNQHIDFIFVLPFRELNMLKEGEYTLLQLLLHFYPELRPLKGAQELVNKQVLFIFDGLDESRFPLDFEGGMRMSKIDQRSTVNVLLTNLIKGNLLPNALLWITSRPAAAGQIPSKYVDQMSEVQGFTDRHKEEYFMKRFGTAGQAKEVLSYLKGMISFYFMGHIPIFCWIIAEVFEKGWSDLRSRKITTMTELYVHYLIVQTQRTAQKYGKSSSEKAQKKKSTENAAMILSLSKLALEQLQKGNIIFYEEDLRECGIDVDRASVFCGFCSEILKQERGLYEKKMFSFVHLSFQEFLAALYMFHCCVTKDVSTLRSFLEADPTDLGLLELHKRIVDKAVQSKKGQLDLFLCFFLGFSLQSNQTMLQSSLPQTMSGSETAEEMKKYLRNFQAGNIPQERCMNLLLCKYELKEERFQDDIRMYLDAGATLSPIDCSVLSTMLQMSGELVEELDLTKCNIPYGAEKLILIMKNCKRAALKSEHLSDDRLAILLSILQSSDSSLRELRLLCFSNANVPVSHNLFDVLESPDCKLETLRLSGFTLDFRHCHRLASILQWKQSSLRALDLTECIYSYPQDYSGYYSQEVEKDEEEEEEAEEEEQEEEEEVEFEEEEEEEYEDYIDELTLLTFIPAGLIGPVCKLKEFSMRGCYLTNKCCQVFASVLSSNSQLRELDLSRNNLQDLGVQLLSAGLGSSKCGLEILRLSCCGITEEGCASLASALRSNPSHLRELDLSFNHPGEAGVRLLSERLEDPRCRLEKLNVDQDEEHWINPQLLKVRRETFIPVPFIDVKAYLARRRRLGLFLDWSAGILSFYSLSGDKKTLLHTVHTTFTEPLHPAFYVYGGSSLTISSAVTLRMDNAKSSFTPEVITERLGVSYRFKFPSSGVFECSLTGLVFKVTHEGEVTYKTLIWDTTILQPACKVPGGPLFSIMCPQDSICQLHLPHCEPEPALVSESLSVLHITDDGMSVIQPLEITETHVVVETPHLSAFGIVWDLVKRFMNFMTKPVRGQVLLFLRPAYRGMHLILSVILLPGNVPLQEVKAQYENCEYIQAPSDCLLHKSQHYSLHSNPEGYMIQPAHALFFENYGPNYHASFEITLKTSTEEVTLMVRDPDRMEVWEYGLHLPASSSNASPDDNQPRMRSNTSAEEKLKRARPHFVDRVSDPVLNKLLDELLRCKVLNDAEGEAARVKPRADKARDVIDMVRKKGAEASAKMITIFSSSDPFLCKELSLN